MQDDETKRVIETLERQYKTEKYGKLHRALKKHGIRTDLYVGLHIEMYYPNAYKPMLTLEVSGEENWVTLYKHEPKLKYKSRIIKKILETVKSLGYKVIQINELPESLKCFCEKYFDFEE
ncbi:MAG: hypothetical protein ACP5KW_09110 [Thermoproteota archaeon]